MASSNKSPQNPKISGLTLVEILIAALLTGVVSLLGTQLLLSSARFSKFTFERDKFDEGKARLLNSVRFLFLNTVDVNYQSGFDGPIPNPDPQILIPKEGIVVLLADRRPCGEQSKIVTGTAPSQLQHIFLTCCKEFQETETVKIEAPVRDANDTYRHPLPRRTFRPACGNKRGLSVDIASSTSSFNQNDIQLERNDFASSWCHEGIEEMNVQIVGINNQKVLDESKVKLLSQTSASPIGIYEVNNSQASKENLKFLVYRFRFSENLQPLFQPTPSPDPSTTPTFLPEAHGNFEWTTPISNIDFDCPKTVPAPPK